MEIQKVQTEFKDMGEYRVIYHKGSELIEIEEYTYINTILSGKKWHWKRVYLGFASRLETALELYHKHKKDNF